MINHSKMFGKVKTSVAYKNKLLAEIAHYEKRIEEALNKRRQNYVEDESFSMEENITNPYKLNLQPSQYELKQQEASMSDRASMTLELGNLTIMQSEVNVMVTPPEVREPVPEDGVWYEVAAECKIDLVSFTITFYAHKPHRKFAPTRYRNIVVVLVKPAHQKELAHSILPMLYLPNLVLQVLQNYATAFRSRRTTLLALAEKYGEKLRMEAMPEGGYRVKCLDLLQVDWMLENLWSPVVPFCHRMKFEVEYMSKDYIQAIGKLYKQFKDPSLGTSERSLVLSKIFDICLEAAGPTRELQESFESDPETAGRLHERRTTIDQEPDVPSVEHSPKKKVPSGKENKPQNRKTSMAPPKTIPKKAKKRPNENDGNESRKSVKRAIESESGNVVKKSRVDNDNSKGGLKGGRDGQDKDKTGADGSKTAQKRDNDKDSTAHVETEIVGIENQKKSGNVNAKNTKNVVADNLMKKKDGKTVKSKGSGNKEDRDFNNAKNTKAADAGTAVSDDTKKRDGKAIKSKVGVNKEVGDINNANKNKDVDTEGGSKASSKRAKKGDAKANDKIVKSKENTVNNVASSKKDAENLKNKNNAKTTGKNIYKTLDENTESNVARSKGVDNIADTQISGKNTEKSKNTEKDKAVISKKADIGNKDSKKVVSAKKDEANVASSKHGTKVNSGDTVNSKEKKAVNNVAVPNTKSKNKEDAKGNGTKDILTTKKVNDADTVSRTNSKTVATKDNDGKNKPKDKNNADSGSKNVAKETNIDSAVGNIGATTDKTKADGAKKVISKDSTVNPKEVCNNVANSKNGNKLKDNGKEKIVKATDKLVEKRTLAKGKARETEDINEVKAHAEKTKVINPKNTEKNDLDKNKITVNENKTKLVRPKTDENEVLAKKRKIELDNKNTKNNDNPKTTKKTIEPKTKLVNATRTLKENTNRDETENEKKNLAMTTKNQKNMLNITITKSKIIPISKLQTDNKLKTKIPMMKSKITFSSLGDKLKMNNLGMISNGAEKKIPQKRLPVFKKVGQNPSRISPRKLPTIKPSSYGFSIK